MLKNFERPTFKYFSWHTALFGMIASISMTFIVSVEFASIGIGLLIALITVLYFRDFPPEWGINYDLLLNFILLKLKLYLFHIFFFNFQGSISQALIFHQVTFFYFF
jgi:potassium/chloride transporter 9